MTYSLMRYTHLVGLMLIGGGLIGVWLSDLRSRKVRDLVLRNGSWHSFPAAMFSCEIRAYFF